MSEKNLGLEIEPLIFPTIGEAKYLSIKVLPFKIEDISCSLYYELITEEEKICTQGNYHLTEEEYNSWGSDNSYLANLICLKFKEIKLKK